MRLATFNVENLFTRYRFAKGVRPDLAAQNGFTVDDLRQRIADPDAKKLTAEVITALDADVLALQEVEDADTLRRFRDQHLGGRLAYPHAYVIDGNDERRIDIGVLSRLPITHLRSWQHLGYDEGAPVFSRDCLEVDVELAGRGTLTLFVNHLKSMRAAGIEGNGREITRPVRERQAHAVVDIVRQRFKDPADAPFVVCGDLNDYLEDDEQGSCGIRALAEWDDVVNVLDRLPAPERWTHFWKGVPGLAPKYRQLDYVLPSRRIASHNPAPPRVERRGLPKRAERYGGPRLAGIGWDRPKASDHCAIVYEIDGW